MIIRKILLFAVALLLTTAMYGQGLIRHDVVSTAGGYGVSGELSVSWTLGELAVHTLKSADETLILTQGFQQSGLTVTHVENQLGELVDVKIYPNPAESLIHIKFSEPLTEQVTIRLFDADGRMVHMEQLPRLMQLKELKLTDYLPGVFYLKIITSKGLNSYKIIKH